METIFSAVALIISFFTFMWELTLHNREKKKAKIMVEVYKYYAPMYRADNLPTTFDIIKSVGLGNSETNKNIAKMLIIELNHEGKIEAVSEMERVLFDDVLWKPNINFHKK